MPKYVISCQTLFSFWHNPLFLDISLDGTVSITDMNSTNGTCVGSSIESIMQSLTSLEQNTAVSICGGDYVSFGVCVCRIIPERARTSRHHQTLDIGNFQPSAFALDQLRILKITMVRLLLASESFELNFFPESSPNGRWRRVFSHRDGKSTEWKG